MRNAIAVSPETFSPDPLKLIERTAKKLYREYRRKMAKQFYGVPTWDKAHHNTREEWRRKALAAIRSEESVLDEMRREDRERKQIARSALSERSPSPEGAR